MYELLALFPRKVLIPFLALANVLIQMKRQVPVHLPLLHERGFAAGYRATIDTIRRKGRAGRAPLSMDGPGPAKQQNNRTSQHDGCRSHVLIPPLESIQQV